MIVSMGPGVMISGMSYDYEQVIDGGESENISNIFSSYNFTIQPGISVMPKLGRIGIEAQAGYHVTVVGGKLAYGDEANIPPDQNNVDYLIAENKSRVTSNWSAYRLSLELSVRLN
jgi:hypothetical protein